MLERSHVSYNPTPSGGWGLGVVSRMDMSNLDFWIGIKLYKTDSCKAYNNIFKIDRHVGQTLRATWMTVKGLLMCYLQYMQRKRGFSRGAKSYLPC